MEKETKHTPEEGLENLREVLCILQDRIDNPNARHYITSDLKECYNTISTSIDEIELELSEMKKEREEAHNHLAEIHNRYKSLMTAKINEKTQSILNLLKANG